MAGWLLRSQTLNLRGQVEVFLGEAAGVMSNEGKPDAIVANVDVRVVAGLFGKFADLVDEIESGDEVLELEGANELAGFDFPAGQLGEAGLSGFRGKGGHGDGPQWFVVSGQWLMISLRA